MSATEAQPCGFGVAQGVFEELLDTFQAWTTDLPEGRLHPVGLLHGVRCAYRYHFTHGLTVDEAVRKAITENLPFQIRKCASCGDEFLSELGQTVCSGHCWNKWMDPDGDSQSCTDSCEFCNAGEKEPKAHPIHLLRAAAEVQDLTEEELRHLLRVLREAGVNNELTEDKVLLELLHRVGPDRANILIGRHQDCLARYDEIRLEGYDLEDAIQDVMDGKD